LGFFSRLASGEISQNNVGHERRKEHSNICRRIGLERHNGGYILPSVVLADLQRKGQVRQRSLSAESLYSPVVYFLLAFMSSLRFGFGYFCGDKSN
jgi:hypothetical protein